MSPSVIPDSLYRGSRFSVVFGGLGEVRALWLVVHIRIILRGFAPARRGPFVSTKGPKTISPRRGPSDSLLCSPYSAAAQTRFAQTVLAESPNKAALLGHAEGGFLGRAS